MIRVLLLAAFVFGALPTVAKACVWLPVREQSKAEKRHWSRVKTRDLQKEAAKRLDSGRVELADELAEMLVPNIRPVRLFRSNCGPEGEIDFAGGVEDTNDGLSDDPRLKDINLANYGSLVRNFDGETALGPLCNAEFRGRFAAWLRARLSDKELRDAWLFYSPRKRQWGTYGSVVYNRLISFDRSTRRPPIRWWGHDKWIAKDIDRFNKQHAVGRRIVTTMSDFWAQQQPSLASDETICPKAQAMWQNDRKRLIDTILTVHQARLLLRQKTEAVPLN